MTTVRGVRCSSCTVAWQAGADTTILRRVGVYAEDGFLTVSGDDRSFTVETVGDPEIVGAKAWRIVGADGIVYEIGQEGCGCRK